MATGRVERRPAAILAADVAGYSRLMGADEEGTHERLRAHLQQLVDPKIEEHRGRIAKNTGDGMLVEFGSVVQAIRCAVEIQRGMIDRNADTPEDERISFRMGVNLGDVIVEPEDIFGDGVNIAARLEALAEPGDVCVSGVVRDQVRDKLPYSFEDMGQQSLKNIARPVRVYSIRLHSAVRARTADPGQALSRSTAQRTNLPAPVSELIGREDELGKILSLAAAHRLVTLTGPGGIGKTRLALAGAHQLLPQFVEGVWLASLPCSPTPALSLPPLPQRSGSNSVSVPLQPSESAMR